MLGKITENFTKLLPLPIILEPRKFNPIHYLERNINFSIIPEIHKSTQLKQNYPSWVNSLFYQQLSF